jgi:hypothetical protein
VLLAVIAGWVRVAESAGCRRRRAEDTGAEPCAQGQREVKPSKNQENDVLLRESAWLWAMAVGCAQQTLEAMREGLISRCFGLVQHGRH